MCANSYCITAYSSPQDKVKKTEASWTEEKWFGDGMSGKTAVLAVLVICILPGTTTYDLCIAMCGVT